MSQIVLRPARQSDAADIAILDNIAGHGISQWFWQGAVIAGKAEDAYDWGRARMADPEAIFGWRNCVVAQRDGVALGVSCNYEMPEPDPADGDKNPEPFVPIWELFSLAIGDWFIDSLAVYGSARGQGAGGLLLDSAMERGRQNGSQRISLVAEDSNTAALALYASRGFDVRDKRPFLPFHQNHDTKEWLLLSAPLNNSSS